MKAGDVDELCSRITRIGAACGTPAYASWSSPATRRSLLISVRRGTPPNTPLRHGPLVALLAPDGVAEDGSWLWRVTDQHGLDRDGDVVAERSTLDDALEAVARVVRRR